MLKIQNEDNGNCCFCLSTLNGVRLTLLLEVLMCALSAFITHGYLDDLTDSMNSNFYITLQCLLFTIASCVSIISGAIGLSHQNQLWFKVSGVSSAIASMIFIVFCICIATVHNQNMMPVYVLLGVCACIVPLRIYGTINSFMHASKRKAPVTLSNMSVTLKETQDQDHNKCCGCFTTITGVRLALLSELLMCAAVMLITYNGLNEGYLTNDNRSLQECIQSLLFAIASCVAVISGMIGLLRKDKLCLNIFSVSSIVASVLWILFCIWAMHQWPMNPLTKIIIAVVSSLRLYGNVNTHGFVRSLK